jgi:AcrR family transcriptional regulator
MPTKKAGPTGEAVAERSRGAGTQSRATPKAPSPRRTRIGDSETRDRLLDAAEQLMREEGYAAITTRKLGAKAGVHPQLVHYYFAGMDNLFLELWRRFTGHYLAGQAQAFLSANPVRTVWEHDTDPHDASLASELMALARHRKVLGDEIANSVEKFRSMQASALAPVMDDYGLTEVFGSPEVLALCMVGLARILVVEEELGISGGHAEARAAIARWLDRLDRQADGAERVRKG